MHASPSLNASFLVCRFASNRNYIESQRPCSYVCCAVKHGTDRLVICKLLAWPGLALTEAVRAPLPDDVRKRILERMRAKTQEGRQRMKEEAAPSEPGVAAAGGSQS